MKAGIIGLAAVLALAGAGAAAAQEAQGNPAAGKTVFAKCAICHFTAPGRNFVGPSLFGVVGRPSASVPGYSYSAAMKAAGKTWDPATLDAYLTDPKAMVPGTKMTFPGLKDANDRKNVIAYLETLK